MDHCPFVGVDVRLRGLDIVLAGLDRLARRVMLALEAEVPAIGQGSPLFWKHGKSRAQPHPLADGGAAPVGTSIGGFASYTNPHIE
jgi:hypothetical protein